MKEYLSVKIPNMSLACVLITFQSGDLLILAQGGHTGNINEAPYSHSAMQTSLRLHMLASLHNCTYIMYVQCLLKMDTTHTQMHLITWRLSLTMYREMQNSRNSIGGTTMQFMLKKGT